MEVQFPYISDTENAYQILLKNLYKIIRRVQSLGKVPFRSWAAVEYMWHRCIHSVSLSHARIKGERRERMKGEGKVGSVEKISNNKKTRGTGFVQPTVHYIQTGNIRIRKLIL